MCSGNSNEMTDNTASGKFKKWWAEIEVIKHMEVELFCITVITKLHIEKHL